nr:hypothetical protein Iba_chr12dCG8360 [Ipomoea batatas]
MAKSSLLYVDEFFNRDPNFLLKNAIGLSSCTKIAPMPSLDASVSTMKCLLKSGSLKIGVFVIAVLRVVNASSAFCPQWNASFLRRRTERDTPLGSAAAAERRRVLRQGYPPNCSATDEHCCFVWPGEESKTDAATNHVTTKQRRREKPPPFKTSRCIATWSTSKVEAAAALASSHVAGKIGNTPVGVPRCRRLGAALTAAHLHSLFGRQRCRLLQEEIATGCSSSVPAALTEWRRNSRRSVLLPLLLRCEGNSCSSWTENGGPLLLSTVCTAERRTERDTPLGSAAAAERRRVLRQEESKADATTNHVTTKQRRREKPPPFKTSHCIATWSTSKVEAAAALASSHVAGKIGNTPVGVPRCRRLGAALTAAHLHSLFRRQRCRLLQEEIATGCSSSVLAALTEWRRNSRRSVLLPLLLRCEGNRLRRPPTLCCCPERRTEKETKASGVAVVGRTEENGGGAKAVKVLRLHAVTERGVPPTHTAALLRPASPPRRSAWLAEKRGARPHCEAHAGEKSRCRWCFSHRRCPLQPAVAREKAATEDDRGAAGRSSPLPCRSSTSLVHGNRRSSTSLVPCCYVERERGKRERDREGC